MGKSMIGFLHHTALRLASRLRNIYYRSLGTNIEGNGWLQRISIPRNWADITLEHGVALDAGVALLCSGLPRRDIGPYCYFTDANHGRAAGFPMKSQPMELAPLIVEDEAWIGAHVTVLPGVRIGKGAVIGAGAVVTHDVPAGAVALGVPARVTHQRRIADFIGITAAPSGDGNIPVMSYRQKSRNRFGASSV
jgi:maltose O-acetyltransferase